MKALLTILFSLLALALPAQSFRSLMESTNTHFIVGPPLFWTYQPGDPAFSNAVNTVATAGNPNAITNGATNVTLTGTFTGNGAGVTNAGSLLGPGYVVTPVYGTNPITVSGATIIPRVNGTYYWSAASSGTGTNAYTNVVSGLTNIFWADNVSGIFAFGTNQLDAGGFQGQMYAPGAFAPPGNKFIDLNEVSNLWLVLPAGTVTDATMVVTFPISSWPTQTVMVSTSVVTQAQLPTDPRFNSLVTTQAVAASNFIGSAMSITNQLVYEAAIRPLMPVPIRQYDPFYDDATGANVKEQTYTNLMLKWNTNGMKAAGWNCILVSDKWCSSRTAGLMVVDATRFPSGMPYLVNFAHTNGYTIWIYTSFGNTSCLGQPGTTEATVYSDMQQFAGWGFDGVQIDNCGFSDPNPWAYSHRELNIFPNAMLSSSNRMALSINAPYYPPWPYELAYENNFMTTWGSYDASGSISNEIWSQTWAINVASNRLSQGHWLYTGGVIIDQGNPTNLTIAELCGKAMVGSVYKSSDITDATAFQVATNQVLQAVQYAPYCAGIAQSNQYCQVWTKQLDAASGSNAVAFVNYFPSANSNLTLYSSNLVSAVGATEPMNVYDVVNGTNGPWTGSFTTAVQSNCMRLFLVWPVTPHQFSGNGSGLTNLQAKFQTSSTNVVGTTVHGQLPIVISNMTYYIDLKQ